jgi:hypothetical protein
MSQPTTIIDISALPELRRIIEEARTARAPRALRVDDEVVAILTPIRPAGPPDETSEESDDAAFLSSFGGWKGIVDGEKLKRDLKEARGSDRPLVVFDE